MYEKRTTGIYSRIIKISVKCLGYVANEGVSMVTRGHHAAYYSVSNKPADYILRVVFQISLTCSGQYNMLLCSAWNCVAWLIFQNTAQKLDIIVTVCCTAQIVNTAKIQKLENNCRQIIDSKMVHNKLR